MIMRIFTTNTVLYTTLFLFISHSIKAQETFSTDCKPRTVSATEAEVNSKELIRKCGFSSVFFQADDLYQLVQIQEATGIRFYIAKQISTQEFVDVIAVAINESGKELEEKPNRSYLMKRSLDDGKTWYNAATGLSSVMASSYVQNIKLGKEELESYTSYLGRENLQSLLEIGGDGIRIYSSEVKLDDGTFNTMSFGVVKYFKGNSLENGSEEYMLSKDPCPIVCGGEGDMNYLWNIKEK